MTETTPRMPGAPGGEKTRLNNAHRHFARHVATMPGWHKLVIVLAGLLVIGGGVGMLMGQGAGQGTRSGPAPSGAVAPDGGSGSRPGGTSGGGALPPPPGSRSFVGTGGPAGTGTGPDAGPARPSDGTGATTASGAAQPPTWISSASPETVRLGLSVVAGFIIGWTFRAFLKMMTLLAALAVGAAAALNYFGVMNVDSDAVRQQSATALHWLGEQAWQLGKAVVAHLPSAAGGAVGAFLGFKRQRGGVTDLVTGR